jgi:Flp pilus assembly pilin Flp
MQDPASHSIRTDASAVKYGLIVAAISLALLTVLIGIGANLTIGHLEAAIR